jgi:hypothetical protein
MAADDRGNPGAILEDNKARVRRYVEEFQSAGNPATADALVAADIIHHHGPALTTGGPAAGRSARRSARAVGRAPEADQRNLLALESLRTVLARHFEL